MMGAAESVVTMMQDLPVLDGESHRLWQVFSQFMKTVDTFMDFINFHLEKFNGTFW